jgi:hypothetical protein
MRLPGIFLICAAALLAGCASYHLGPVNGAVTGEKSIEVVPFGSQPLHPRLGDAVTQALRERLQTDGTYHLVTQGAGAGDVVVTGNITGYSRVAVAYLDTDVTTAQTYRINLTAHVTARERATGRVLLDKDVTGYALVAVGLDLASAERQAAPLIAEDLAQNIVELIAEGAW